MKKIKFEYVWLDGYMPEPLLRSKTKTIDVETASQAGLRSALTLGNLEEALKVLPIWNFDGSSTKQAEGKSSDCLLKPVKLYRDEGRPGNEEYDLGYLNSYLVLCEVLNPDGTPHPSNTRALIENDSDDIWFGFEQEYTLANMNGRPLGFPENGFPYPQGTYYCGVGSFTTANNHLFMRTVGRRIVERHYNECLMAGLDITGINAEVLIGQWEFQCFGKGGKNSSDDLQIARYLLHRIVEDYNVGIELGVKPESGDWNGSGCHTNFSNGRMRDQGGKEYFDKIFAAFKRNHDAHIAVYGSGNEARLTGHHETAHISEFRHGVSDRGASIRTPVDTARTWTGYLEDRRPGSNMDPYKVSARVILTLGEVD